MNPLNTSLALQQAIANKIEKIQRRRNGNSFEASLEEKINQYQKILAQKTQAMAKVLQDRQQEVEQIIRTLTEEVEALEYCPAEAAQWQQEKFQCAIEQAKAAQNKLKPKLEAKEKELKDKLVKKAELQETFDANGQLLNPNGGRTRSVLLAYAQQLNSYLAHSDKNV